MIRRLSTSQLVIDGLLAAIFFGMTGLVGGLDIVRMMVAFGMSSALAVRRLAPGWALLFIWVVAVGQLAAIAATVRASGPQPADFAVVAVLYATSAYGGRLLRWLGFASAVVGAVCVTVGVIGIGLRDGGLSSGLLANLSTTLLVFFGALAAFVLAWTLGILIHTWRRSRDNRLAAAEAERQIAAEQERTRIARDMHDVVAHSLAVVIAQSDGARYLRQTDPEAVDEALRAISGTAREALADVRVLLAQLRYSQADGPQPTLAELDRLYAQVTASGVAIEPRESGEPLPLGTSAQLAIFRIVQESLTNVLRHADLAVPAIVAFDWSPGGLTLTVSSGLREASRHSGALPTPGRPVAGGHGIAGMTERASLVGGRLDAQAEGARFTVRAWLPAQPGVPAVGPASASGGPEPTPTRPVLA